MNINFHIPMPHLTPTEDELIWAKQHLIPDALAVLNKIYDLYGPTFDKADFDQQMFSGFSLAARMREHISELGLSFRKFSLFLGYAGRRNASPHIDSHTTDGPMVARLNVPLQGQHGARLSWWDARANDPRIAIQKLESWQWDSNLNRMRAALRYLSTADAKWEEPAHVEHSPGPCWNRVELVHRIDLEDITEHRVNLTADLDPQVSWEEIVSRLNKLGYIS